MKQNRRDFLKTSALATAAMAVRPIFSQTKSVKKSTKMKLSWTPYDL